MMRKLVGLLLLLVCPSALMMGERPSAMLYATGNVTLNGAPAATSTSVFAGDRIDTASASVVSINRDGSVVIVDPNSSIEYQDDGFSIFKGMTRVRTSRDITVHAGFLSVMPKTNSALFDISSDGKTVLVASREGVLKLTDGVETATLNPGFTAKVSLDVSQDQDQGPNPAATTKGTRNKRKVGLFIVIFSAAAGVGVACAFACVGPTAVAVTPVIP